MSLLTIVPEREPTRVERRSADAAEIAELLAPIGVRFERWAAGQSLAAGAGQAEVIEAYRADVDRLAREGGYQSVDVARVTPAPGDPAWPAKAKAAREKFLSEHTHAEDEVRFFVEGAGLFYLRAGGRVFMMLCERGDLISVPAGTTHWFDMGGEPNFCAIRLFGTPDGWVASFTGDAIAAGFPGFDEVAEGAAFDAVLVDIEGTVGSIAFVKEVLFPYSRRALPRFVAERGREPAVRALLDQARSLAGEPGLSDEALVARLQAWVDEDRKVAPLKGLQGLIWEEGFRRGEFRAHLYPDVPPALRAWAARGLRLFVFSSGSVHAQKLYFGHSDAGDLAPLFEGHFDTTTGPKGEPASYRAIAAAIGVPPGRVAFLSDSRAELDAARAAGLGTLGLAREGAADLGDHPVARDLASSPLAQAARAR
jgi:2,3-diketo-5-methylthio-1-phosphopentane phosphatase